MAKTGRPKSTFAQTLKDHLPEDWEEQVLAVYEEGGCDVEVMAMFVQWRGSMSNDLWQRWMDEESNFSETIKRGHALSQAWWLRLGREASAGGRESNPTMWIFNMKNRMGWKDRSDVNHSGKVEVTSIKRTVVKAGE